MTCVDYIVKQAVTANGIKFTTNAAKWVATETPKDTFRGVVESGMGRLGKLVEKLTKGRMYLPTMSERRTREAISHLNTKGFRVDGWAHVGSKSVMINPASKLPRVATPSYTDAGKMLDKNYIFDQGKRLDAPEQVIQRYRNDNLRSRLRGREDIAHEAFHANNYHLGGSETLARLYGGWKAPLAGSSLKDRAGSAAQALQEYMRPGTYAHYHPKLAPVLDRLGLLTRTATKTTVKSGAAARALFRAGKLSTGAVGKLRSTGVIPEAMDYAKGLARGNTSLLKRYGIQDLTRDTGFLDHPVGAMPFFPHVAKAHPEAVAEMMPFTRQMPSHLLAGATPPNAPRAAGDLGGFHSQLAELAGEGKAPAMSNMDKYQMSALVRRHEIDEIRAAEHSMGDKVRASGADVLRANPQSIGSHFSPYVLEQEGKNITGLSPNVQSVMLNMRRHAPAKPNSFAAMFGQGQPELEFMRQRNTSGMPNAGLYSHPDMLHPSQSWSVNDQIVPSVMAHHSAVMRHRPLWPAYSGDR